MGHLIIGIAFGKSSLVYSRCLIMSFGVFFLCPEQMHLILNFMAKTLPEQCSCLHPTAEKETFREQT